MPSLCIEYSEYERNAIFVTLAIPFFSSRKSPIHPRLLVILSKSKGVPTQGPSRFLLGLPLRLRCWPPPVPYFGFVYAFRVSVVDAFNDLSLQPFLDVCARTLQPRHPVDHVDSKSESIHLVSNGEFQRRIDVSLLFISTDVNVGVIRPAISKLVHQPGISVKIENHRLVLS